MWGTNLQFFKCVLYIFTKCANIFSKKDIKTQSNTQEGCKSMRIYEALLIARYIIEHEFEHSRSVSNLRLQKLLYFVQLYFLMCRYTPCFSGRMEAWDFGPVVPEVYHKYKRFGSMIIQEIDQFAQNEINENDSKLIDEMLDACACKTTRELVEITHQQSPWKNAYRNPISNEITLDSIRELVSKVR